MILGFIILVGILILIHEFGHFLTAKFFKIRVEEFGIGFPPRLIKIKKGETIYSFNLIPFGGFVKLYGEDEIQNDPFSFSDQKPFKRLLIIIAGVISNILLAYFILALILPFGFYRPIFDDKPGQIMIFEVAPSSPAYFVGLQKKDIILGFNQIKSFQEFINQHKGKEVILNIQRGEKILEVKVVPRIDFPPSQGPLGVGLFKVELVQTNWPANFSQSLYLTFDFLFKMIDKLVEIFKNLITKTQVPQDVVGPVGLFHILLQLQVFGWGYILFVFALISLNLALINILPFPALDGGRALFVLIEMVTGKAPNKKTEAVIHLAGFIILILLGILVTLKDIKMIF